VYDLLIQGVTVYDGTGGSPFEADVAVEGDRIAAVEAGSGKIPQDKAEKSLAGGGLCLSPGFIDVHSHSDIGLLACPTGDSKIHQGITTDVFGQCGFSAFPVSEQNRRELIENLQSLDLQLSWSDLSEYRAHLEEARIALNVMTTVGHGTIRAAVMGYEDRAPTADELKAMSAEVEKAMDQGAFGLSSGLQYPPGRYAATEEVVALSKAAKRRGGIYTTHMRCEGERLMESVEETLSIGKQADIPVIISHLKASGHPNWGRAGLAITMVEIARREGRPVLFDRYPYLATSTSLDIFMPAWAQAGGREKLTERIESGEEKLITAFRSAVEFQSGWNNILIVDTPAKAAEAVIGKSITQIAKERGEEPWRTAVDLLIEGRCRVDMCHFAMCQEDTDRVLAHPCCMVGSDAGVASPRGVLSRRKPHPRAYGTFPRFLGEYIRNRQLAPLEEAIRRITWLPAQTLGLQRRGKVEKGYAADLVLFRLEDLEDLSRYGDPHHFPTGIRHVIVNGCLVIEEGSHTDARPGRFLTRSA